MLSIYKKIGQFTYFDIRDTEEEEDLIIKDGVTKDDSKRKWVAVTAVKENKNSTNRQFVLPYTI